MSSSVVIQGDSKVRDRVVYNLREMSSKQMYVTAIHYNQFRILTHCVLRRKSNSSRNEGIKNSKIHSYI